MRAFFVVVPFILPNAGHRGVLLAQWPMGMKSAQQLGCQKVSSRLKKTEETGCEGFQRILLTHCHLPCRSAVNC
ncbi:hypothetical protein EYF80_027104 [Liparis tanakae]|uniref:Uncharacterized protein n=1 Tax=Liparis tanakae TaxID=230148 RepID=A0A4Z2HCC7_9TELE|nr:hypothetical protein EYF80_027104 [Liparis tanakae]